MIPAEAVEALAQVLAQEALVEADMAGYGFDAENDDPAQFMDRDRARKYLEAAAPHMLAGAWDEAVKLAAEVAWEHDGSAASGVRAIANPYRPTP